MIRPVWELARCRLTYRRYQPNQPLLLPPDLQEWVPPGHLAHHVSDVVDALDLAAFYAPYEGDGPQRPLRAVDDGQGADLCHATGTFSSRAVARKLEDLRCSVSGCSRRATSQHRTVCEFRRRHLAEFSELFVGVVQVAREMGLARFGKLSVDGTKVRANASKRKAMSYERMGQEASRLQAEIEALLTKAGPVDAEEDERWGWISAATNRHRGVATQGEAPGGDPGRQSAFGGGATCARDERGREPGQDRNPRGGRPYKRAYGEPEPKAQSNFTDPESQIMKTSSEGFQQCYNAQMAVDGEHQIIVATQVGPQASDQGQLVGMLDEINETFGVEPAVVLADAGYCNEPDLLELEDRGIDAHVALGRDRASPRWRSTRPGSLPRAAWVRNWRAPRAKPGTRNASGSRRRRTGGSRRCSDSDDSACEAWRRCAASGTSCAWR